MKEVHCQWTLGASTEAVMERVFGEAGLRSIHGESVKITLPWTEVGERRYTFSLPVPPRLPAILRPFLPPVEIRVAIRQQRSGEPGRVVIRNRLRLNALGQELLQIRPVLTLREVGGDATEVTAYTRLDALLPPGFRGTAEGFMRDRALAEYRALQAFSEGLFSAPAGPPFSPVGQNRAACAASLPWTAGGSRTPSHPS